MMHERYMQGNDDIGFHPIDLEADTARWTSPAYQIRFGNIAQIISQQQDYEAFRMSAWGLSRGLTHLLNDYTKSDLQTALDWLVISQNGHMLVMLNQVMDDHDFDYSMLDRVFITIDTELFLPQGLRMHVTCVTNIVQVNEKMGMLDKFVAVLDPGEAEQYIQERRGMTTVTGIQYLVH